MERFAVSKNDAADSFGLAQSDAEPVFFSRFVIESNDSRMEILIIDSSAYVPPARTGFGAFEQKVPSRLSGSQRQPDFILRAARAGV